MRGSVGTGAVVAAVVLLFGVAVADALREHLPSRGTGTTTGATAGDAAAGGRFIPLAGVGGSIVFTAARDCRVREIDVVSGEEAILPPIETDCRLRVERGSSVIAYGDPGTRGFGFADLEHPEERVEGAPPLEPVLIPKDVEGLVLHAADGSYGSVGLVVRTPDGEVLAERYVGARLTDAASVPHDVLGGEWAFAPDNCALLARRGGRLRLLDLGCFRWRERSWQAKDAAWSPGGEWVAMAVSDGVLFERVVGIRPPRRVLWPVGAAELGWRADPPD
jgi:hypothetical protein